MPGGLGDFLWLLEPRPGLNKDDVQRDGKQFKKISERLRASKEYSPEGAHMLLESCFKFMQAAAMQQDDSNTLKRECGQHVRVKRAEE